LYAESNLEKALHLPPVEMAKQLIYGGMMLYLITVSELEVLQELRLKHKFLPDWKSLLSEEKIAHQEGEHTLRMKLEKLEVLLAQKEPAWHKMAFPVAPPAVHNKAIIAENMKAAASRQRNARVAGRMEWISECLGEGMTAELLRKLRLRRITSG
jgi:hypothetical protein